MAEKCGGGKVVALSDFYTYSNSYGISSKINSSSTVRSRYIERSVLWCKWPKDSSMAIVQSQHTDALRLPFLFYRCELFLCCYSNYEQRVPTTGNATGLGFEPESSCKMHHRSQRQQSHDESLCNWILEEFTELVIIIE